MRLPSITNEVASDVWNAMNNYGSYDSTGLDIEFIGDDADEIRLTDLELSGLREAFLEIQGEFGDVNNKKALGGVIDAKIVEATHGTLCQHASVFQLSQPGFWRWCSSVACDGFFWNFIKWRIGGEQQVNWGITSPGNLVEVYLYRAWLRGHRMYDSSLPDPYYYAKRGSSDVWRSHILRQEFGRDREFVKAFLDTLYNKRGELLVSTQELRTKMIPVLRAWTSNASFAHLSYDENLALIKRLRDEGI